MLLYMSHRSSKTENRTNQIAACTFSGSVSQATQDRDARKIRVSLDGTFNPATRVSSKHHEVPTFGDSPGAQKGIMTSATSDMIMIDAT